jgi:hypothetical protein
MINPITGLLKQGTSLRVCPGNAVCVDQVFGNDATGARSGPPFLHITNALLVALPGDVVWINPGTYNETLNIPTGVSVRGMAKQAVIIQLLNVTTATDLVEMNNLTSLEDVTLRLTSVQHVQLRGVVFKDGSTTSAQLFHISISLDNTGASPTTGQSNVYGIHMVGSGGALDDFVNVQDSTILVMSSGNGTKRGILLDGSGRLNVRDVPVTCMVALGNGSYIGVETNNANAVFSGRLLSIRGSTADISQTQGTLALAASNLRTSTANGLGFTTSIQPDWSQWSDDGALPGGATNFLRALGTSGTEIFTRVPRAMVAKSLSISCTTAPANPATFVLRRNNVNTILTATLTATTASDTTRSVSLAAGDLIAMQVTTGAGGQAQNVVVTVDLY